MDGQPGSQGHVLPCTDPSGTSQVPEISLAGTDLPISGSAVRSVLGSLSFYQGVGFTKVS